MRETLEETEYDFDAEAYEYAIQDARYTLDQQIHAFNEIGGKCWRLVRYNALIGTVFAAGSATYLQTATFTAFLKWVILIGFILLVVSTIIAVIGQQERSVKIGVAPSSFKQVRQHDPAQVVYLYRILEVYEESIEDVQYYTEKTAKAVRYSKILSLIGTGVLVIGTLVTLFQ